jgi:anti-sigma factor RsiW
MSKPDHVSDDQLVRMIDDELTRSESTLVELHLVCCAECSRRHQELRSLSLRIEAAIVASVTSDSGEQRESLRNALEARERKIASSRPQKVLQRFGWGMAVAAMLSLGILFGPQWTHRTKSSNPVAEHGQTNATFDVDGETFAALPYSNPDLPVTSPHVVQMQIPVSSLTDAGIILQPVSSQISAPDASVLADVLLGTDGQPLGVHVLPIE